MTFVGQKKWLHNGIKVMFAFTSSPLAMYVVDGRRLFLPPQIMCTITYLIIEQK
jgi:hypothetical protein